MNIDNNFFYITGKTNDSYSITNAMELRVEPSEELHIRDLLKYKNQGYFNGLEKDFVEKNRKLYEILMKKHLTVFNHRPNSMGKKLEKYKDTFDKLSVGDQMFILLQILRLTSTNEITSADLKLLGGSAVEGKMMISKNITGIAQRKVKQGKVPKIILINQSPSGLFESKIDLLTV